MNILFLGYWGAREGLSASTIYPHLRILSSFDNIERIIYCSIEREGMQEPLDLGINKLKHIPLISGKGLKDKLADFTKFPKQIVELIEEHQIDKLVCRGAPAGALGYLVWRKTKTPFYVESFEPHAAYMLESGVWKAWDPRYLLEAYWEQKQKKYATALMPVAENYTQHLVEEGVAESKLHTIPCCVPVSTFVYSEKQRQEIRERLGWEKEDIVGIYVGKFGGIYYEKEAYDLFQQAYQYWKGSFRLIILTPQPSGIIQQELEARGMSENDYHICLSPHEEVPNYLSAADFAFSLQYPSPSKKYLSPIKNGEYWANGLPILLTYGVGDDTDIIGQNPNAGAHFYPHKTREGLTHINQLLKNQARPERFKSLQKIAIQHRDFYITEEVYQQLYT